MSGMLKHLHHQFITKIRPENAPSPIIFFAPSSRLDAAMGLSEDHNEQSRP
jgi:hypothetical protein